MTAPFGTDRGTDEPEPPAGAASGPRPGSSPPPRAVVPDPAPDAGMASPPAPSPPAAPPRPSPVVDPGRGWAQTAASAAEATTVLPGGAGRRAAAPRAPARPEARPAAPRPEARPAAGAARALTSRSRRARLTLKRVDPWSVFLFSLVASVFVGIALIVAAAVLYAVLGTLGVTASLNELFAEVTGGSPTTGPLLTSGRIIGGAAVLAAVNVVFLTLLATLGALLYNLCASFTGGIELTLGERS